MAESLICGKRVMSSTPALLWSGFCHWKAFKKDWKSIRVDSGGDERDEISSFDSINISNQRPSQLRPDVIWLWVWCNLTRGETIGPPLRLDWDLCTLCTAYIYLPLKIWKEQILNDLKNDSTVVPLSITFLDLPNLGTFGKSFKNSSRIFISILCLFYPPVHSYEQNLQRRSGESDIYTWHTICLDLVPLVNRTCEPFCFRSNVTNLFKKLW